MTIFRAPIRVGALFLLLAPLFGCAGETEGAAGHPILNGVCASGSHTGSNPSGDMNPGMDCVGCHASGDGPSYAVAGTVYPGPGFNDEDTCNGASGVTVTLTDSAGNVFTKTSNAVGSFYFRPSEMSGMKKPYRAEVSKNGQTRAMSAPQTDGACNTCHDPNGRNGAPGRILQP